MDNKQENFFQPNEIAEVLRNLESHSPAQIMQGSEPAGYLISVNDYEYFNQVEKAYISLMLSISQVLDTHESYLAGHSARIALLATELSKALGHDNEMVEQINLAGHLHDIGEIIVPTDLLRKSGELTEEELELIKLHPAKGAEIIRAVHSLEPVASIVESHHERYDGAGYPNQLSGNEIPVGARILAVVDTYDAITNFRLHKSSSDHSIAVNVLKESAGKAYDPEIVETFISQF